jgi:Tfp pilus assembly ATPase PilU
MITMDRALLDLYRAGEISYDTALSIARHPEAIKERMA